MRVWEENGEWIEETYILAMHSEKYSRKMIRKFLEITNDKTEAMVIIPTDEIYNLFVKHYNLTLVNEETKLYIATRK